MKPFFSIALTTFDRVDLLRESIQSVLGQTYENFELLVGNDNTQRLIEHVLPDISDPRIRWINHPENLGPVGNVNRLLELSSGAYFTTLSDDDLFFPSFLEKMHVMITEHSTVKVFFSEYLSGHTPPASLALAGGVASVMPGSRWLDGYLSKDFFAIGCYGVFEKAFLVSLGGAHTLGSDPSFSPYNDNLMAVQAGIADTVVFLKEPLIFFRLHQNSMSHSSTDVDAYSSAQIEFIKNADKIFKSADKVKFRGGYYSNILPWFIADYFSVFTRSEKFELKNLINYYIYIVGKNHYSDKKILNYIYLNKMLLLSLIARSRRRLKSVVYRLFRLPK